MSAPAPRVEVHDDGDELATSVAGELLSRLADLQAAGKEPQVALTGGTIAEKVHREVARLSPGSGVDWTRVVVWWGDERFVPSGSDDRNARAARRDLLDVVGATQVHEVPSADAGGTADEAAAAYAATLRKHGAGTFDVLMLGIGPDGHCASLFPGFPQLDVDDQVAVGVHDSPKPPPDRVSLTFGALGRSDVVWFLASGEAKADAVARALADQGTVTETPARGVRGTVETTWWLDRESASQL